MRTKLPGALFQCFSRQNFMSNPLLGSAHETENKVRLGLPRIIRLKENAPEFDYSSFYAKTGAGDALLCGGGSAFLMTCLRTAAHEETELLTVLYFPICRVPEYSELSVAIELHPCISSRRARNIKVSQERPRVHHRPYIGGPRKSLVQSVPVPVPSSQDLPRRRCRSSRCFRGQAKERSRPCRFRLVVNASHRGVERGAELPAW